MKRRGFIASSMAAFAPMLESGQNVTGSTNVKDFGATGDGLHDDSGPIQAAIDSLKAGGTVEFPPGAYFLRNTLVLPSRVTLHGSGAGASTIVTKTDISQVTTEAKPGVPYQDLCLRNLTFRHTGTTSTHFQVDLVNPFNCHVDHCTFISPALTQADLGGIRARRDGVFTAPAGTFLMYVESCLLENCSIDMGVSDSAIHDTVVWGDTRGYAISVRPGAGDLSIQNCQLVGSPLHGAVWVPGPGPTHHVRIVNVFFDGSYDSIESGRGMDATNMHHSVVFGCNFWNNSAEGVVLTDCSSVSLIGNSFFNNNKSDRPGINDVSVIASVSDVEGVQIVANLFQQRRALQNRSRAIAFSTNGNHPRRCITALNTVLEPDSGYQSPSITSPGGGTSLAAFNMNDQLVAFATPRAAEATGTARATLGGNCPARESASPHSWITVMLSDGTRGFIPVWR